MSVYPVFLSKQVLSASLLRGLLWETVSQETDVRVNNTTTVANTDLVAQTADNAEYEYELLLSYVSGASADIKFGWDTPSGASMSRFALGMGTAATGTQDSQTEFNTRSTAGVTTLAMGYVGSGGSDSPRHYYECGKMVTGDGGPFTVQFAQLTAVATDTFVQARSSLRWRRTA